MNSSLVGAKLNQFIPKIREYDASLEKQNLWWSVVAMVGKVNNQNMEGQLLDSITETQQQFEELRGKLIENMVQRYLDKVSADLTLKSQAFVDTLNRNLFERTADVGFLATDNDLVEFLHQQDFSVETVACIEQRLVEYVKKYSVYDDVVILTVDLKVVARFDRSVDVAYSQNAVFYDALKSDGYIEFD